MTCDEEFRLFLIARPEYTAYGSEPINPSYENGYFRCSNLEERAYYRVIVSLTCRERFDIFLAENPIYMEGFAPTNPEPYSRVEEFECGAGNQSIWFGLTYQAAYNVYVLDATRGVQIDLLNEAGIAFAESERESGDTIDIFYQKQARSEYGPYRIFAADGRYVVSVRRGSRYHVQFPQYIIPLPNP